MLRNDNVRNDNAQNVEVNENIMLREDNVRIFNAQNVEVNENIAAKINLNNAPYQIQKDQVLITDSIEPMLREDSAKKSLINDNTNNGQK